MVTLTIPEAQIVNWVQQLTPDVKRMILRALIPALDDYESLVDYGRERAREVAARHGQDWEAMSEAQRAAFVDTVLHETRAATTHTSQRNGGAL